MHTGNRVEEGRERMGDIPGHRARRGDIDTQIFAAWSQRTCDTAQYQVWTDLVVYGVESRDQVVLLGAVEGGGTLFTKRTFASPFRFASAASVASPVSAMSRPTKRLAGTSRPSG